MARFWCDHCGNFKCTCKRDAERAAQRRANIQDRVNKGSQQNRAEWTDMKGILLLIAMALFIWLWSYVTSQDGKSPSAPSSACAAVESARQAGQRVSAELLADCIKES